MPRQRLQNGFFFGLLLVAFALVARLVRPYLTPLVFAAALAIIFWPLHKRLRAWLGHRSIAALVSMLVVLSGVLLPILALTAIAVMQAQQVIALLQQDGLFDHTLKQLMALPESVFGAISPTFTPGALTIDESIGQALRYFIRHTGAILSGIAGTLIHVIVFLYALYYFFKEGEHLPRLFTRLSPLPNHDDAKIIHRIRLMVTSIILGALLIAVIQGVLTGVGFAIFGVPGAVLWGIVTVPISFVPWLGTAIIIVPGILYLLIGGSTGAAIGLIIWGGLVVGLIDNLLNPEIIGARAKINPLLVLVSVLGGLQAFGVVGFVAGPIVLSVFLALLEIYQQEFRDKSANRRPQSDAAATGDVLK